MGRDSKETGKIIANMVSVLSFLLVAPDMKANTTWDLKKVLGLTSTRMAKSIKETGKQIEWKALVGGQTRKDKLIMVIGKQIRGMALDFILTLLTRPNMMVSFARIFCTAMEPTHGLTDPFTEDGGIKVSNMGWVSIKVVNLIRNMDYGTWGSKLDGSLPLKLS